MPAPLSQALKYVHRLNERNQLQELPMRQRDNASQNRRQHSSNKGKFIKQEIQPDFEHIMSLFDKMKEQFQREINERYRNNVVLAGYDAQNEYNAG